jgi:hypothetical protein
MKERKTKKGFLPLLCAAAMVFTAASVWEGAVTTAPRGSLPDEGYYAATNSFPRNTIVDVTNLETGKTVRVIVSSGLDTPGLLATLSEEAAKSIGLQTRSIGRIRMTQPSDPIAFSRFTEGLAGSGDPDYDPEAMLEADETAYDDEDWEEGSGLVLTPAPQQLNPEDLPPYSEEERDYFGIVELPGPEEESGGEEYPEEEYVEEYDEEDSYLDFPEEEAELAETDEEDDSPEKTLYPIWARGGSVGTPVYPDPVEEELPQAAAQPAEEEFPQAAAQQPAVPSQAPVPPPAPVPPQPTGDVPARVTTQTEGAGSWASAWITAPQPQPEPPAPGTYDYSLIPAEQRPPIAPDTYAIPPEAEIGPIASTGPERPVPPKPVIDESLFIESIENMRERTAPPLPEPVPALSAAPEAIASPLNPSETLPESVLVEPSPHEPAIPEPVIVVEEPPLPETAPKTAAAPERTPKPAAESAARTFSVPVIGDLEKGKYYLQLGAYSKPDVLESSVSKLDSHYPLSVQRAGSPDKPLYRLLLGPVNLGESGALLQRFKGSGYSDAFVRSY